jgi:WD40 repeat protein
MPPSVSPPDETQQQLRQACAELERRLRAGQPCAAEDFLVAFPALAADADAALELIYTEFVARQRLGQRPDPADCCARFPQWRRDLEQLFEVHRAAAAADGPSASATTSLPPGTEPAAPPPPDGAGPGRRVGGYEVLAEIGRGGMGVVYKARQAGLGRLVALKVVLAGEHGGPRELARFRTEATAAARLHHPHIVEVHDVGEHDGRPFLALEWVEGGSLAERLTGAPWPAREAARLVQALAGAAHHAHQRGVIHRDLKPANVLLTADGQPKVADFGLARRLAQGDTLTADHAPPTATGAVLGTPAYMAPEQVAGAKEVGPAADVYALGSILYELLTGRPPFRGVGVLETLEQVRSREPAPPSRLQPRLPRDLDTVCLKCLRKEPAKRYASAEALAEDLGRFLAGEPVRARPTPWWERAAKWARRRPAVAALLAAVMTTAALGVGGVAWSWRQTLDALGQAERERDLERKANAEKTISLARQAWLTDDFEAAGRLLDECPPPYRGRDWRYLDRVCRGCLANLGGGDAPFAKLIWSPEGARLAAATHHDLKTDTYRVIVWEAASGRTLFSVPRPNAASVCLAFTPDGRQLTVADFVSTSATIKPRIQVKSWDAVTGEEVRESSWAPFAFGTTLALSPDGRRLAGVAGNRIKIWEAATGQEWRSISAPKGALLASPSFNEDGRLLAVLNLATEPRGITLPSNWAPGEDGPPPAVKNEATEQKPSIYVWDAEAGQAAFPTLPVLQNTWGPLVFSPASPQLVAVSFDSERRTGIARVFNLTTGREDRVIRGHSYALTGTAFTPDGRRLATSSIDRTVILWDAASGAELLTFRGHKASVDFVAFSPDGRRLASAGEDGTVRVWDVRPLEDPPD